MYVTSISVDTKNFPILLHHDTVCFKRYQRCANKFIYDLLKAFTASALRFVSYVNGSLPHERLCCYGTTIILTLTMHSIATMYFFTRRAVQCTL